MLTSAWPPVGRVGARRPLRLARRLGALGWTPVVLTPEPRGAFRADQPHDPSLVEPAGVDVHRVPALFPSNRIHRALSRTVGRVHPTMDRWVEVATRRMVVPDQFPEWTLAAVRAARSLEPVDAVWVTGGPWGMFVVGAAVARILGRPLVLDYRDPWSVAHGGAGPRPRPRLEAALLRRAGAVVYVNEEMRRLNEARFGPHALTAVIPNGFDPLDLGDGEPTRFPGPTLLHAGHCYADRRIQPVMDAMADAPGARLEVYGRLEPDAPAWLRDHPRTNVAVNARVPASTIARHLRGADALLLLIGETHARALSGKVFDYLAAGRPILVVGPPGCAAAALVARCRVGEAVPTGDRAALVRALRRVDRLDFDPVAAEVARYSADVMARDTARVLDAVR